MRGGCGQFRAPTSSSSGRPSWPERTDIRSQTARASGPGSSGPDFGPFALAFLPKPVQKRPETGPKPARNRPQTGPGGPVAPTSPSSREAAQAVRRPAAAAGPPPPGPASPPRRPQETATLTEPQLHLKVKMKLKLNCLPEDASTLDRRPAGGPILRLPRLESGPIRFRPQHRPGRPKGLG